MRKFLFILLTLALSLCAQESTQNEDFINDFESEYSNSAPIKDPLIAYNRFMHTMNWGLYDYIFSPVLDMYRVAMPKGYQLGIYNFFDNLYSPLRFLALLFAGEPKNAMDELGRFVLNSTAGVLGIFDVASENGLYSHRNDFGITFGKWGMDGGFHIVLPLLGPSNLRDTLAMPLNLFAYPTTYLDPTGLAVSADVLAEANYMARHKATLDSMRQDSLDNYILFRDSYEQRRAELISENKGQQ
ncbi:MULTISPECIES: MlaA family lipoprotein [Helicobacter]|uniref:MlaA family lipoprotein n=2 Tax=Helicobacteraceae TaxID=72293 RepID=UPI0023F1B0E0|nr:MULTISPECIES: VacJ family lipoprotein [Helicobacter]MCI5632980.1 VacJ family lipoprotein [Helicobacter sp.]MDY5557607.1 VacJ family lipoprotein [Helicobacter sp.]